MEEKRRAGVLDGSDAWNTRTPRYPRLIDLSTLELPPCLVFVVQIPSMSFCMYCSWELSSITLHSSIELVSDTQ